MKPDDLVALVAPDYLDHCKRIGEISCADKLDPEKVALRPELAEVGGLAEQDLEAASLRFFDLQLSALVARGQPIHPAMVEARNEVLARRACESGE